MNRRILLLALASLAACSPSGTSGLDGAVPAAADLAQAPDLYLPWPRELAPPVMLSPVDATWYAASPISDPTQPDPVLAAIEAGTFDVASEDNFYGADWYAATPDMTGSVSGGAAGLLFYAEARVDVPVGTHVLARVDSYSTMYVVGTGAVQPGDPYGSGAHRVPVILQGGKTEDIVFRAVQPRADPQAQLFSTTDEVYFNLGDVTGFDPVEGDTAAEWLGIAVVNLTGRPALDLEATVEESDLVKPTTVTAPSLPPGTTKVAFQVSPKAGWPAGGTKLTVGVRVASKSLQLQYRADVPLTTVAAGKTYRRSFRSAMDNSAQYMGVVPPSHFDPSRTYALVLTLHGAGVEGIGQAQSYAQKDYAYVVAGTNRRPFGFDWEEWGRGDALEVQDEANRVFKTDPTQQYLTGHSMGGHGTWNNGVLFPGRFAMIGPSAGWGSFYSYTGSAKPTGAFARSQASSDTFAYLKNLSRRGAYVIQGLADTNVPPREERALVAALRMYTMDVQVHEEPGAGHWWSSNVTLGGASCVDWPDLFTDFQAHRLDPTELEFDFTTPLPSVNAHHSFVTVLSQADFTQDAEVTSSKFGADTLTILTGNVRSASIDGHALRQKGILHVTVGKTPFDVPDGPLAIGPQTGKHPGQYGPFNDALRRPFCFVYDEAGPAAYRHFAAYLTSEWDLIGNGQACALPLSAVTDAVRAAFQIIYLGVRPAALDTLGWPVAWSAGGLAVAGKTYASGVLWSIVPEGDRLGAVIAAAPGAEPVLFHYQPFHSGFAVPDYMVIDKTGVKASGFVNADWTWN